MNGYINKNLIINGAKNVPLTNLIGDGKSNVDLNDFKTTGIFYLGTNLTNAPTGIHAYLMLVVLCNNNTRII